MLKQVIVIRKDLNMRKGKMVAQGAHASLAAVMRMINMEDPSYQLIVDQWFYDGSTKICVSVNSEEELMSIKNKAQENKVPFSIILDSAKTEFKEPTWTAVALGPYNVEDIDKITGELKLL